MGNKNTKFFDDLSKGATWSAGVAFKRSNPLPLDRYSVFETKALAEAYATSNAVAYPGQVIAVAEGNKMVAYVLAENTAGDALVLQQIGIIPTGDDKTINVTEDGVISLLAADTEVFKKDAEGNPTEEKEINAGAQLVLQADGTLKWVKPDTTTVEGLSTAVEDLKGRMTTAEADIDALETKVGKATEGEDKPATGLYALIDAETARATAAEKALDDAIKAIDFMDSDEVADAIEEGIKDLATKKYVDDELAKKVNAETYNTDKKALEDEDAAIREIAEGVKARVDAFLDGEGTEKALDSLQELIAYIDSHDDVDIAGILEDIEGVENKLVGIDTTVAAYVTAAIDALQIGDYAKAADLANLAERVATLEGKVDVDKVSTAIAAAEGRAATDAQSKADKALADAKADTDTKLANYYKKTETYSQTEVNELIKDFATDDEVAAAVDAEAKLARAAEKANADAIAAIKDDATIDSFADVVTALAGKQATGDYATKTEAKGYADAKDTAIGAAQGKADSAYTLAQGAQGAAEAAQGTANTNAANIEELDKFLFGRDAVEGQDAIVGLNTKVAGNTTRIGTLEGTLGSIVNGTSSVPKAVEAVNADTLDGKHASEFATAGQGALADSAVQSVSLTSGTDNGTVKLTVDGVDTDNIKVKGLGTAAYKNEGDFVSAADGLELNNYIGQVSQAASSALDKIGVSDWISSDYADSNITKELIRIDGELDKKAEADKVYTKDEVNTTVNGINTEIGKKADKTYVDEELGKRDTAINDTLTAAKKYVDDKNLDQYTTEQEVKDIVDTVVAAAVEGDALEGLTDLVEYINTHGGEAAEMAKAIEALEAKPGLDKEGIVEAISGGVGIVATPVDDGKEYMIGFTEAMTARVAKADTAVQPGDLGTMAKETAADYVKKSDATGYTDILTKTEAATKYQPVGNYAPADIDTGVMSVTSLHDAIVVTPGENGAITINFADEIILNGGGANVAAE